jgi:hypothetical protein
MYVGQTNGNTGWQIDAIVLCTLSYIVVVLPQLRLIIVAFSF